MPGSQDTPDSYTAERILRDIIDLRLTLLNNDQSALCSVLWPLELIGKEQVYELQKISSDYTAKLVLTQYAPPRLLTWMGIR